MAKLHYSAITSLDGYVADASGSFDWAAPKEDVFRFVNDLERDVGTYLYGRRMYETMAYWESFDPAAAPAFIKDFCEIWRHADKVVFSSTLHDVATSRTRLERSFDPGSLLRLKESAEHDLSVGGADLAGQALRAGLVDEIHLFLVPAVVGGGISAFKGLTATLELLASVEFPSGFVYLRYRVAP